jgi:hypothetical protein
MRRFFFIALIALAGMASAQAPERHAALERAYDDAVAAQAAWQQAEEARARGVEPLAGERVGTASGRSRLAPEYWERQSRAEEELRLARERLDEALARWNALR